MQLRNRRIPSMKPAKPAAGEADLVAAQMAAAAAPAPVSGLLLLLVVLPMIVATFVAAGVHLDLLPASVQQQLSPVLQKLEWLSSGSSSSSSSSTPSHIFSREELAQFTGGRAPGDKQQIYVAILGEVFDVTSKPEFYAAGNGYAHFAGTDGSKSFITGDFVGDVTDDVTSLDEEACLGLVGWLDFYHKTYPFVGKLAGAFYDASGAATPALASVHSRAAKGKEVKAQREKEEQNWPSCNSKWTEETGGEVWCDDGLYPRKLFVAMVGGRATWRCACFKELGWSDVRKVYVDCAPDATRCSTDGEVEEDDTEDPEAKIRAAFS